MRRVSFQYFHEVTRAFDRACQKHAETLRMLRLNVPLTIQTGLRIVMLAGIAAASLQTVDIAAQDSVRSDSPRPDSNHGDAEPGNRADGERAENRQRFTENDRRGRFGSSGSNRRTEFNRVDRDSQIQFFREGEFESQPTDEGFVFVNGEFLPRPYTFRASGKQTFVNDQMIASELLDVASSSSFDDEGEGFDDEGNDYRGWRRRSQKTQQTYAEFLSNRFGLSRHIIVVFDGQSPTLLPKTSGGNDLLSVLVSDVHRSKLLPGLLNFAGSPEVASRWSGWVQRFQPSDEFLTAAQPIVDQIDAAFNEGQARQAAIRRLDSFAYPLTIAGLIISVFAIGHLMSNPPNGGKTPDEVDMSPEVVRIVTRSLALVVALSLLDLVWTLLASQAGSMRELNPVGGRLIDDPAKLIIFKVALTGLAAGLIFKLRYYRRAQLASWWACLILTLLTVRWLTFNSMLA